MTETIEAQPASRTETTREVAREWFRLLGAGQVEDALELCAEDLEFENYLPVPGYNTAMPWIGTKRGRAETLASFGQFVAVAEVQREELVQLVVEGDTAIGIVHEVSRIRQTGRVFEIEFIQRLTVRDGVIQHWKSYTDPSPILRAMAGAGETDTAS